MRGDARGAPCPGLRSLSSVSTPTQEAGDSGHPHVPPSAPHSTVPPRGRGRKERRGKTAKGACHCLKTGDPPRHPAPSCPPGGEDSGEGVRDPQGRSEKTPGTNTAPLLLLQKTPQIYSVELNGDKDAQEADKGGGEEKYRGLQDNRSRPRKKHHKDQPKTELELVSGWTGPSRPWVG